MFESALAGRMCPAGGSARAAFNRSSFVSPAARMPAALRTAVALIGIVANIGIEAAPASPQSPQSLLTFYTDKTAFQSAAPGLSTETFDNGVAVPDGYYATCSDPYGYETDDFCWDPGQVLLGLSIASSSGSGTVLAGGATSISTGAAQIEDALKIGFAVGTHAAGMDLVQNTGTETVTLAFYDAADALLGTTTASANLAGTFFGVTSPTNIARIELTSPGGPLVDNLSFAAPVTADLKVELTGGENPTGTMNYTVVVTNQGPAAANAIVASLQAVPSALAFVSDDCGGSGATTPWTWNIANLANGAQVTCHVVADAVAAQGFASVARVQSGSADLLTKNNVAAIYSSFAGAGPSTPESGIALFRSFYDLAFKDETGAPFSLRDNADKVILLQVCAQWCPACAAWTSIGTALKQAVDQQIGAGHFLDVDLLVQNGATLPSSQADAAQWKSDHNFPGPVMHAEGSFASPLWAFDIDLFSQYYAMPAQEFVPEFFILTPGCDNQIVVRAQPASGMLQPTLGEQLLVDTTTVNEMATLIANVWNQRPCAKPLVHRLDRCSIGNAPVYFKPGGGNTDDQESAVAFNVPSGKYNIGSVTAVTDATNLDVTVYSDSGGLPGSAVCSGLNLPATSIYTPNVRKATLGSSCSLGTGNYWMGLRGHVTGNNSFVPQWQGGFLPPNGSFVFRNPGNDTGYGCASWTPAGQCIAAEATTEPCFMLERDSLFESGFEASAP